MAHFSEIGTTRKLLRFVQPPKASIIHCLGDWQGHTGHFPSKRIGQLNTIQTDHFMVEKLMVDGLESVGSILVLVSYVAMVAHLVNISRHREVV